MKKKGLQIFLQSLKINTLTIHRIALLAQSKNHTDTACLISSKFFPAAFDRCNKFGFWQSLVDNALDFFYPHCR